MVSGLSHKEASEKGQCLMKEKVPWEEGVSLCKEQGSKAHHGHLVAAEGGFQMLQGLEGTP